MWFSKKERPAQIQRTAGFFSTEWEGRLPAAKKILKLQNQLAITFQKGIESVKQTNSAMDSQFAADNSHLSQSKLINSRIQGIPDAQLNWYAGQGFIGWQTCAMLSQNWLIDKACSMPAKDACRNGYEVTVNDGTDVKTDVLDYIRKKDKAFKVLANCMEFVRMGRIFGIRIALFQVDSPDKDYYAKPFNPDGIKAGSYKGISQIDPYWIAPQLDQQASSNPAAQDFYEPTWWNINGKLYHRTHLVIMRNSELPDILKPTYIYGGMPVPQRIAERVYAAERTANEAPLLTASKRLTTLKVDITQAEANLEVFQQKIAQWCEMMNNFGVKVIGGDEEVNQFDTSLADLDNVIMTQFQLVSAASEVPATKLLGTTPKGFNATGEYDDSSYHEFLETIQEHDLTALVDRHHLLLIRSEVAPKFGIAPFSTEVHWKPVDAPTAKEQAEVNLAKAQADNIYSSVGAIDGEDIRNRLIGDKESGYNGVEAVKDIEGEEEIEE